MTHNAARLVRPRPKEKNDCLGDNGANDGDEEDKDEDEGSEFGGDDSSKCVLCRSKSLKSVVDEITISRSNENRISTLKTTSAIDSKSKTTKHLSMLAL